jgi:hypothetical protein
MLWSKRMCLCMRMTQHNRRQLLQGLKWLQHLTKSYS